MNKNDQSHKHIEIVAHCYNPAGTNQYVEHLRWLLSAVEQWSCSYRVTVSVCCTMQDTRTALLIDDTMHRWRAFSNIALCPIPLAPECLFRRAIGRNAAALQSKADVIWFTDVDYFPGPKCLGDIATYVDVSSGLCMPSRLMISTNHEIGAAMIERELGNPTPQSLPFEFTERKQKICIGGCQIIGGDFARTFGYLGRSEKWITPIDASAGFRSCKCDVAFRKYCKEHDGRPIQRLPIRDVYRIRHTMDGRDYDGKGRFVGKHVW